jgi:hypothetical protein
MGDNICVTFRYALGQRVHWRGEPRGRWRVIARLYEESRLRRDVRYQVRNLSDTDEVVVYEEDLAPLEDTP